jgi:prephenate dehydrogenase
MKRIAIVGVGLMGGSIGLALRKHGFAGRIAGYARRAEVRALALSRGMVDEATDSAAEAVRGADLVILCLPILANAEILATCTSALAPGCIVTDVGSTKFDMEQATAPLLAETGATFVGSHPIAGSEQQGAESARDDLYDGALVVVTQSAEDEKEAARAVSAFWRSLGARVESMSAATHDAVLSRTSHLPHLAASAVALAVGRERNAATLGAFCGPGFVDTTRVAEGSPAVWLDILRTNRQNVMADLDALADSLLAFRQALAAADDARVYDLLEQAQEARQVLMKARNGTPRT